MCYQKYILNAWFGSALCSQSKYYLAFICLVNRQSNTWSTFANQLRHHFVNTPIDVWEKVYIVVCLIRKNFLFTKYWNHLSSVLWIDKVISDRFPNCIRHDLMNTPMAIDMWEKVYIVECLIRKNFLFTKYWNHLFHCLVNRQSDKPDRFSNWLWHHFVNTPTDMSDNLFFCHIHVDWGYASSSIK